MRGKPKNKARAFSVHIKSHQSHHHRTDMLCFRLMLGICIIACVYTASLHRVVTGMLTNEEMSSQPSQSRFSDIGHDNNRVSNVNAISKQIDLLSAAQDSEPPSRLPSVSLLISEIDSTDRGVSRIHEISQTALTTGLESGRPEINIQQMHPDLRWWLQYVRTQQHKIENDMQDMERKLEEKKKEWVRWEQEWNFRSKNFVSEHPIKKP
jgi:hypothetical protein